MDATTTSASSSGAVLVALGVAVLGYLIAALPLMGVFGKAGRPGWAAFVPIYNLYVLLKLVGRPGWWLVLYFIPLVNIVIYVIVCYDLAKSFGHGAGFTVGLVFLYWIFLLILWLGGSQYRGAGAAQPAPVAA